jgi:hypothetical protein
MKRALLFGGVPVLAGIALIVMWALADQKASRGNDWTQVLATIETATAQPGAVDIAYQYQYGGRQYRNPAGRLTLTAASGNAAARYAKGRQVLAYVNPAAPSESILEPHPRPSNVNLLAGIVLLIIGLPVGAYLLREKHPRGPAVRGRARAPKKPVRKPSKPLARLKPPPSAPRK